MGIFPMAEDKFDPDVFWVEPDIRGIIPLDGLHISKSLNKKIRKNIYTIKYDEQFSAVIDACADTSNDRNSTWINADIRQVFIELHKLGYAHSVEAWQDGVLVGGLYGLALNGAFFGESMFSKATDASKICLYYLVQRLKKSGFTLLDTQFTTEHLIKMGAVEKPKTKYQELLAHAMNTTAQF